MSATVRCLAITGTTGYIGTVLARRALAAGWSVRALSRRPPADRRLEHVPYSLETPFPDAGLDGVEVVVHLAADTGAGSSQPAAVEFAAARALLEAARRRHGTRVVFVSSQTARADAPTDYGRRKWMIEQEVLAVGGIVIRPGLVYGGAESGLFGVLSRLVRRLPVLPNLVPSPIVQPIHVCDLADGMLRIAATGTPSDCYSLAATEPISFTEFLRAIAHGRVRRPRWFLPAPFGPVMGLLALARHAGSKLDPERLRSLKELPRMETAADLASIGLTLRTFAAGMHASGDDRRRRLLIEARVLLGYLLRDRPPSTLCRRYVRSVERLQGGEPLALPEWLRRWPGGLALLDGPELRRPEVAGRLEWRLEAATLLAESSPIGARRFLLIKGWQGPLPALLRILRALAGEGAVRLARLPLGFWLRAQRTRVEEETR